MRVLLLNSKHQPIELLQSTRQSQCRCGDIVVDGRYGHDLVLPETNAPPSSMTMARESTSSSSAGRVMSAAAPIFRRGYSDSRCRQKKPKREQGKLITYSREVVVVDATGRAGVLPMLRPMITAC